MRDWLIELLKQKACHYVLCDNECGGCKNVEMYDDSIESIADHLLANGVIVPPCKVGDTVYISENPYTFLPLKKVVEGEVVSIHLHEHGLFIRVLFDTKKINGCVDYNLDWKLGKTVFLTREEAEQALKGE